GDDATRHDSTRKGLTMRIPVVLILAAGSAAAAMAARDSRAAQPERGSIFREPLVIEASRRVPEGGPRAEKPEQDNHYPWFGDFDGDGKPDLLVGDTDPRTRRGRLRIYPNTGTTADPEFGEPIWFQ